MYHPDKDYLKVISAVPKFTWLPKRCVFSKKTLWLTFAYRIDYGFYNYTKAEPKDYPYHTPEWCSSKAYVFAKLKGEL